MNRTFREIGFWGSVVACILGLVNVIICLVKAFEESVDIDFLDILWEEMPEKAYYTVLYKVSLGIVFVTFIMMFISYLVNVDGVLKVLMIICKIAQLGSVIAGVVGYFIVRSLSMIQLAMMILLIIELIAFILYLIDRDHRKTAVQMLILSIVTVGGGLAFAVIVLLLFIFICILITNLLSSIFGAKESRNVVYDLSGKVVGYWKREDY